MNENALNNDTEWRFNLYAQRRLSFLNFKEKNIFFALLNRFIIRFFGITRKLRDRIKTTDQKEKKNFKRCIKVVAVSHTFLLYKVSECIHYIFHSISTVNFEKKEKSSTNRNQNFAWINETFKLHLWLFPVTGGTTGKMTGTGHRKSGTPNPMTAAGKQEHALVAQTIEEMITPRLMAEVGVLEKKFHLKPTLLYI